MPGLSELSACMARVGEPGCRSRTPGSSAAADGAGEQPQARRHHRPAHATVSVAVSVWLKPLSPSQVKVTGPVRVATVVNARNGLAAIAGCSSA